METRKYTVTAVVVVTAAGLGVLAVRSRMVWFRTRFPFVGVALTKTARPVWPPRRARAGASAGGLSVKPEEYPDVDRSNFSETLHGQVVADPYRWLEEPDSEETKAFIDKQNELTSRVLARCEGRSQIKDLVSKIMDYPKRGLPWKRGERWYHFSNTGLQNQDVLNAAGSPDGEATVFLDPNQLSDDGTVALGSIAFTYDGSKMAYMTAKSGSDWKTIRVKAVGADGAPSDLPDVCDYVRFSSLSWTRDGGGFFYNRFDKPQATDDLGTETDEALNQKLYYHRVGGAQGEDAFLFAMPGNPRWMCGASVTDDGRWLWLTISNGCEPTNKVYVCDLAALPRAAGGGLDFSGLEFADGAPRLPFVRLADDFSASWGLVAVDGTVFTIQTNAGAPRERLVALDMAAARDGALTGGRFREVVPQHARDLLQGATPLRGDVMVVQWMRDVVDVAELRRISDGALLAPVPLPTLGTMSGAVTEPHRVSREFWFSMTSFVTPSAKYRADADAILAAAESERSASVALFHQTELKVPHNAGDYETRQVFVRSKDGTKVPMFIVHHKDVALDGSNPTLLYGYGGFNISLQPTFAASRLAWLKAFKGVYALANLRGGGEYGRGWRDDGSLLRKQNVFDDFQACAEHLVSAGYCAPGKLVIQGGSNGGLLVAACANQRPDLYGCVLAQVGVMDMLRFHKFTIGHFWRSDFGDPDDPRLFDYLKRYSPLHNVAPPADGSQYPAMLLLTASHDDRVSPLHTFKHLAELQYAVVKPAEAPQTNPLVARIETKAGHGAGKPTAKVIEEVADMFAFAGAAVGAKLSLPS